jgi:hypothetical protein
MRYLRRHGDRGSFKRQDEVEDESPHLPFGITTAPPCHELFMSAFMNSYLKAVFGLIRQDEILREFAFAGPGDYLTSSTRMVRVCKKNARPLRTGHIYTQSQVSLQRRIAGTTRSVL